MKYWKIYVFCMDTGYDTTHQTAQILQCILWPALRSSELDIQYRGSSWGAGMAQWWEPSPPNSLTRGWVCGWFSPCSESFPPGSPVFPPPPPPPPQKNSISITNSTRLEGLNENPLFLSKYFNSNFYFSLCNKDRRASRGQKKGGHWNVVLWSTGFSMISDKQLSNLVERSVSWWVINQRDGRGRVLATLTLKTLESAGLS